MSPGGSRFTSSAPSSSAESDLVQHWDLTRRTYQSWGETGQSRLQGQSFWASALLDQRAVAAGCGRVL